MFVRVLMTFLFLLTTAGLSFAQSGASIHQGSAYGSSGWDLDYGYDEELDAEDSKNSEKVKAERRRREEEQREKKTNEDFFATESAVYDNALSKTELEKQEDDLAKYRNR